MHGVVNPPILIGRDEDFDNTMTAWLVRLDKETGALLDQRFFPAENLIGGVHVDDDARVWLSTTHDPRSAPSIQGTPFIPRGREDGVTVALDAQLTPLGAALFGGAAFDESALAKHGNDVAVWTFGGGPLWLNVDGALTSVRAGNPFFNAPIDGDALVVVAHPRTPDLAPPPPPPFSPHVMRVGGSGFDAANGVAFLSDGSLIVTGRFTATNDVVAGVPGASIPIDGETDWTMGFVAKFSPAGIAQWALSAGAPVGVGLGFPIQSLVVDASDDVFVAGNVGEGGGRFALNAADEHQLDGAFVAKLDASSGNVLWVTPLGAPFVAVPALGFDDVGLVAMATEATGAHQLPGTPLDQRALHVDANGLVTAGDARAGGIRGAFATVTNTDFTPIASVVAGDRVYACGPKSQDVDDVDDASASVIGSAPIGATFLDEHVYGPFGCSGIAADGDRIIVVDTGTDATTPAYGDVSYTPRGFVDVVVAQFDLDLNPVSARAIGGRGYERPLAVAAKNGKIAIAGDFRDGLTLDNGVRIRPVRGDALVIVVDE